MVPAAATKLAIRLFVSCGWRVDVIRIYIYRNDCTRCNVFTTRVHGLYTTRTRAYKYREYGVHYMIEIIGLVVGCVMVHDRAIVSKCDKRRIADATALLYNCRIDAIRVCDLFGFFVGFKIAKSIHHLIPYILCWNGGFL